ncbi:MAG: sulfatase-like hydrolase/transferase, partial [Acidobacteria bacterium]|nr:sulfatase-like hydrolase/transferase [Acidobacteriota bacterium]
DTLRADRLGAYGNTTVPTPNFDRLAQEGVRAREATTHVPITRPAHTTLFTGRYPADHGVRDNISLPLAAAVPTLAQTLKANGFATAAFVSTFVLASSSGLDRGFDHSDDLPAAASDTSAAAIDQAQRRGDATLTDVEHWLAARSPETRAARTALWVHLYDPHDPYDPPEPFASRFADRPYDGEVAWTDTLLGRLRASLEREGLWNDALVVVTADHGESLGEHGESGHGFFAYETTLRVPFVMRGPGMPAGRVLDGTVRLVDVAPTVTELLGLPPMPSGMTGTSFASHLPAGGAPIARPAYAESLTPLVHYQWSDLRVWREGPWKYILAPRPELYDLDADPGETRDLAASNTAVARRHRAALEGLLKTEREQALDPASRPALSAETLQKLGALGSVSPGAPKDSVAQGADPKDKIAEFNELSRLMREGLDLLQAKRYADSAARFTRLREVGADSFQLHFYLGEALAGLGRRREAEASYLRSVAIMPAFTAAHLGLANARIARKDLRGAIAALHQGQKDAPNEPQLYDREGQVWQTLGDPAQATAAYQRVIALAPADALARWRLGEIALSTGAPDRALALFREATTLDPSVADFWNSLGMVLGGAGQHQDAAAAFREATTRDANNPRYAYNLGLVLQRAGNPEARVWFERTLALDSAFRPARERLAELAR